MKNIEELLEYLKLIENEILNAANDTLQMSVFTFFKLMMKIMNLLIIQVLE